MQLNILKSAIFYSIIFYIFIRILNTNFHNELLQNPSIIIVSCILSAILGGFTQMQKNQFLLTPEAFRNSIKNLGKNEILMDVRTPVEHKNEHIEGSALLDFMNPKFRTEIKKLDPSKTYFLYCRSGNRSNSALKLMKKNGFDNVQHLSGGISAWKRKNYPTTSSK
jgi:rhodanese-related sulfurtransferase